MSHPIKLADVEEYLDSEKKTIQMCVGAMIRRYATNTNMASEDTQRRFTNEAKGLFAENGFIADVEWSWQDPPDANGEFEMSPTVGDQPDDQNIYWQPRIRVLGRVDPVKEFDHEHQQYDVTHGVLDGKPGYVDPNTGSLKEDPKKKDIY